MRSLPDEPGDRAEELRLVHRIDRRPLHAAHARRRPRSCSRAKSSGSTMNTFRPAETTPDFNQSGWATGLVDRFALSPDVVLETTFWRRLFEINVDTDGREPMVYAPETQSGSFFNDQERDVRSLQVVEALSVSRDLARPARVQVRHRCAGSPATTARAPAARSRSDGSTDRSPSARLRSADRAGGQRHRASPVRPGPLAHRPGRRSSSASAWTVTTVVERRELVAAAGVRSACCPRAAAFCAAASASSRAHAAERRRVRDVRASPGVAILPRTASRSARGRCRQRLRRISARRKPSSATSSGISGSAAASSSRSTTSVGTGRTNTCSSPIPRTGEVRLSSDGTSRYWELETTARYLGGGRRDLTVSYVRSQRHGRSEQLRSVLRQLAQSAPARERAQPDRRPMCRIGCWFAARSVCRGTGTSRRSWRYARGSRGRRSTNSRTSSVRATAPDGCPRCGRWTSR